jgi:hypothetical protein
MITIKKLEEIIDIIAEYKDIEYRIINNTVGKNLILLNKTNDELQKKLTKYKKYIQEIILESDKDDFFINDIKSICTEKNTFVHRNISYINWNRKSTVKRIKNVIAGYSFKGGMGRSTTLAYLSYFYYLMGKKIVVIDSDFEAPGISSMFFTQKERSKRAGVLDYLIDLHIEDKLKLDDYYLKFIDKDNEKTGSLYLFPSGIDYYTNNYINKISKIDFNSQTYTNNFTKLIDNINDTIKPDLIFIDLRAGINESNGFILKSMSNMNFLFFNSEEQNKDGLTVILNSLEDMKNYHIVNSTIRHYSAEVRKIEENKFEKFMDTLKKDIKLLKIKWLPELAKDDIIGFVDSQYQLSNNTNSDFEMQNIIKTISKEYFYGEQEIKIKPILEKLEKEFSKLIAQQKFENEEDLKYFYFKSDITEIVNDQIFLILGAKGTGKSAFFEIFTKNYEKILNKLEITNNKYIAGFSKNISDDIGKDYLKLVLEKANNKIDDIERFWKFLTLFQIQNYILEKSLFETSIYFNNIIEIKDKFMDLEIGIEVDKKLKDINSKLYDKDMFITFVYDELDVELTEKRENFIDGLIEFWRGNRNKYNQCKSKILLRTDIFKQLKIENKTHLEHNKHQLKWEKYEILSLILKIITTALNKNELKTIGLTDVLDRNNEIVKDEAKIKEGIYKIFGKKLNESQSNISTMDRWIISYLSDGDNVVTPRVIYKFLFESIKKELIEVSSNLNYKTLLPSFGENYKDILYEVSIHKITEYDEEYKDYNKYYKRIEKMGYRIFEEKEFKVTFKKDTKVDTVQNELKKLLNSGFIMIKDEKKKMYQVANVYVPALKIKMNRQGRRKK